MERMNYIQRVVEEQLQETLARGRSVLLLGARQTGKTTLIRRLAADMTLSLVQPDVRQGYERNAGRLRGEVEALAARGTSGQLPLVVIDEIQKVPALMDSVQDLIDRQVARFVLTGSSARKLRHGTQVNRLPGRVAVFHLDPLSLSEHRPGCLDDALLDGSLPGIVSVANPSHRESDLSSYVTTYLEEEVRAEAVVRNLGSFARFLELAAAEAGGIVNLRHLASDVGVAHTTIAAYYQVLEDCLVVDRIEPLSHSATRKKLTRSDKYLFFDLGVRRLAAREARGLIPSRMGALFEQFVGMELARFVRGRTGLRLRFWRDPDGPEVDWIVDNGGAYTPVEVKWTDVPELRDAKHIQCFLNEYPSAGSGYVVCRAPRRLKLADRVFALPWQELLDVFHA